MRHLHVSQSVGLIIWAKTFAIWAKTSAIWPKTFAIWAKTFAIWAKAFAIWAKAFAIWPKTFAIWPTTLTVLNSKRERENTEACSLNYSEQKAHDDSMIHRCKLQVFEASSSVFDAVTNAFGISAQNQRRHSILRETKSSHRLLFPPN